MTYGRVSELEKLEDLILQYKTEEDDKRKHVAYINLVEEALKVVKKVVLSFYQIPNSIPKDDLIQVGAIGMLQAIEAYKVEERGSFKTYVTKVIKGKIYHYLRDKANLVKTPRETLEKLTAVRDAMKMLSENNTKIPTVEAVASFVKLPKEKVEEIMNIEYTKNMISLDQSIYTTDGNETLLDRLQDDKEDSFEEIYANKKIIEYALNRLQGNDRTAIVMYYIEGESRKNIANHLKVSPTQVSRILKRALSRLATIIRDELSDTKEE